MQRLAMAMVSGAASKQGLLIEPPSLGCGWGSNDCFQIFPEESVATAVRGQVANQRPPPRMGISLLMVHQRTFMAP
jgi:hypothetical protein